MANDIRDKAYREAPDLVKEMYASETTGTLLTKIAENVGLSDKISYKKFALAIGDIILGIYPKSSLRQILKDKVDLNEQQIATTEAGLLDFLGKLPEREVPATPTVITIPEGSPEGIVPKEMPVTGIKDTSSVKPLRTFAMDVDISRAHGYGAFRSGEDDNEGDEPTHHSSQDDIIKK